MSATSPAGSTRATTSARRATASSSPTSCTKRLGSLAQRCRPFGGGFFWLAALESGDLRELQMQRAARNVGDVVVERGDEKVSAEEHRKGCHHDRPGGRRNARDDALVPVDRAEHDAENG